MGLLQKAAMTSMPAVMAEEGMDTAEKYIGGFTPEQKKVVPDGLANLRKEVAEGKQGGASSGARSARVTAARASSV